MGCSSNRALTDDLKIEVIKAKAEANTWKEAYEEIRKKYDALVRSHSKTKKKLTKVENKLDRFDTINTKNAHLRRISYGLTDTSSTNTNI